MFGGDTQLIAVEGDEAIGRSTLLAQFARRHSPWAISIFLEQSSRLTYDLDYIRVEVCRQLHAAMGLRPFGDDTATDAYTLARMLELQRQARRQKRFLYVVVNGLQDVPAMGLITRNKLLGEMLPLTTPYFRFLISGDLEQLILPGSTRMTINSQKSIRSAKECLANFLPFGVFCWAEPPCLLS